MLDETQRTVMLGHHEMRPRYAYHRTGSQLQESSRDRDVQGDVVPGHSSRPAGEMPALEGGRTRQDKITSCKFLQEYVIVYREQFFEIRRKQLT